MAFGSAAVGGPCFGHEEDFGSPGGFEIFSKADLAFATAITFGVVEETDAFVEGEVEKGFGRTAVHVSANMGAADAEGGHGDVGATELTGGEGLEWS